MLKKTSNPSAVSPVNTDYLNETVKINGTYSSDKDTTIAATIEGDVHVDGLLIVAEKGVINGMISAPKIDISGKITGKVDSNGKVILRKSAVIEGNLYIKSLAVEAQAIIEGEIHMPGNLNKK